MPLKEILYYVIFPLFVKITKDDNFFIPSTDLNRILINLSDTRENIWFFGMECCKLMLQTIFFFLRFILKGIICIVGGFKMANPFLGYVQFKKYHQATFVVCIIQYIWTDYNDIRTDYWEKINLISFLLYTRYQYSNLLFYLNHQIYS